MTKSRGKSRIVWWAEAILLLAGSAGIGAWAASIAAPAIWQSWENWTFDREVEGKTASVMAYLQDMKREITRNFIAPDSTELQEFHPPKAESPSETGLTLGTPDLPNNALVGRLAIPRLHLRTTVREGTGAATLLFAAGHIRGTSLPGQNGNVGVAAHRDTLFRSLVGIRENDWIQFETIDAAYAYKVASIEIVKPEDVGVLKAGRDSELTLVTCYPFDYIGSAPERFVVKARQVSDGPRHQPLAEVVEPDIAKATMDLGPTPEKAGFRIGIGHSQQLAPGISLGVTGVDRYDHQVDGWIWIMSDRRTIWVRHQSLKEPLVFYQSGKRRELMITNITDSGVTGYGPVQMH